jgi:hypothetical protein
MVRLNLSAAAAAPPSSKRRHVGFMEILALCLLVIAGLGASAYFGMQSHWIKNLRHPHSTPASTSSAPTAVIPETTGVSPTPLAKPRLHEQKKAVTPGTPPGPAPVPGPVPANDTNNGQKNTVPADNHGTPPATDTKHQDPRSHQPIRRQERLRHLVQRPSNNTQATAGRDCTHQREERRCRSVAQSFSKTRTRK